MKPSIRNISIATTLVAASLIATLWSWNTLAEWLNAPRAEIRHAVAVFILITTARALFSQTVTGDGRRGLHTRQKNEHDH